MNRRPWRKLSENDQALLGRWGIGPDHWDQFTAMEQEHVIKRVRNPRMVALSGLSRSQIDALQRTAARAEEEA